MTVDIAMPHKRVLQLSDSIATMIKTTTTRAQSITHRTSLPKLWVQKMNGVCPSVCTCQSNSFCVSDNGSVAESVVIIVCLHRASSRPRRPRQRLIRHRCNINRCCRRWWWVSSVGGSGCRCLCCNALHGTTVTTVHDNELTV